MDTKVLKADDESIARAAQLIRDGQLVGMPTETVYGLAADAMNADAVRSIFAAKGRPSDNPLIVHIAALSDLEGLILGELSPQVLALAQSFWPGPLTLVLPKGSNVPDGVTAGLNTVAVRMPSHPVARRLIQQSGCKIAAPSANLSGKPSPTTAQHVYDDMQGKIPLVLDGGESKVGLESTVLDMTGDLPTVLRPGGITVEMLRKVLGTVNVDPGVLSPVETKEPVRSPGMKYKHYAPDALLTIVKGEAQDVARCILGRYDADRSAGLSVAILGMEPHRRHYGERNFFPLGQASMESAAAQLFAQLRRLDDEGVQRVYAEAFVAEGIGLAIMNRMNRAAAFHIIDASEGE